MPLENEEKKGYKKVMSFKFYEDQKVTIDLALGKAKKEINTEFDSVAIEAICLNYLSGGVSTKPKNLNDVLGTYTPVEVLNAVSNLWPNLSLTVSSVDEENSLQS